MKRRAVLKHLGQTAVATGALPWLSASYAASEPGVTSNAITIGASLALSGPLGNSGKDHTAGLRAAFATVNRNGGIHGRELRLITADDAYTAARSVENVQKMANEGAVLSMISQPGTPNNIALLPVLEKHGLSLVGPITGSLAIRKPDSRHMFHIRPSYAEEVACMLKQLVQMGVPDIAFVYLDNAFGKEVLAAGKGAAVEAKMKVSGEFSLDFDGKNAAAVARQVGESKADAVFMASTGSGTTDFILALRKEVGQLPIVGMSVTYSDLARLGSERAIGLVMAAVYPRPNSTKYVLVRQYQAEMAVAQNEPAKTGSALESWINAQVLIEGLRRAGRDVGREKLHVALASIRKLEVGELQIGFSGSAPYVGTLPVKMGIYGADFKLNI